MRRSTPPSFHIVVIAPPSGSHPLWVRERWVGLVLPLAQRDSRERSYPVFQVLDGPHKFWASLWKVLRRKVEWESGYLVDCNEAVQILEDAHPEAAAWWRENAPHMLRPGQKFIFGSASAFVMETG